MRRHDQGPAGPQDADWSPPALAVMLGVAFMAGTLVLTDTIGKTFDDLFADVYDGHRRRRARPRPPSRGPTSAGDQRGRVDQSLVDDGRRRRRRGRRRGQVFGYARLVGRDGEALGRSRHGRARPRRQLERLPELNPFTLVEGRAPRADDEVVIDRKSAERRRPGGGRHHHRAGPGPAPARSRVTGIATLRGRRQPRRRHLRAVHHRGGPAPGGGARQVRQHRRGRRRRRVPGRSSSDRDRDAVPEPASRRSPARRSPRRPRTQIRDDLSFFNTFMLMFAVIALLVGAFMIFNTFSITVAQRTPGERAAAGARRQPAPGAWARCWSRPSWSGSSPRSSGLAAGLVVAAGPPGAARADSGFLDLPAGSTVVRRPHGGRLARRRRAS